MDFEPGPELDAEIVRRVFGGDSFPSQAIPGRWVWYRSGALDIVPPYSTDIAAAWQVVEHFHDSIMERIDGQWFVWLGDDDIDTGRTSTLACDTAPLAICLAALQVLNAATPEQTPEA
jgi:hypothetical protein